MNRRDIIIVAVLINAGLLVTLFLSSLKKENGIDLQSSRSIKKEFEVAANLITPPAEKDPIDQLINEYRATAKIEKEKEASLPSPILPAAKKQEKTASLQLPIEELSPVITVEKGDALEKIARTHRVTVDEIMKLNHLSNSRLQIGQELKLPEKKPQKIENQKEDKGMYYVVKGGDSPWTIAQKHHIQVEELLKLNHIDEEKAKKLRPGDRLKIK